MILFLKLSKIFPSRNIDTFIKNFKFLKDKIGSDLPVIKMSKSEFKKSVRK